MINDYTIILCTTVGINLILVQSFNLPFGLGMLFNLAHIAFYAIGAYTTALLSTELNMDFMECAIASMCMGGMLALLVGGISLRLSSDYFAMGTLAFHSIVAALLINWKSVTRGVLGIPGIPRPDLCDFNLAICEFDFNPEYRFLMLVLVLAVVVNAILYLLFKSPYGRALRAQSENEHAALSIGIPAVNIRIASLVISALGASLAGCLFAHYIRYIDPSSFALSEMIFVLTITVFGRPGSFWGVAGATMFLTLLPEPLRFIGMPSDILGPMRQLLYALILFAAVFWNRKILFPIRRHI